MIQLWIDDYTLMRQWWNDDTLIDWWWLASKASQMDAIKVFFFFRITPLASNRRLSVEAWWGSASLALRCLPILQIFFKFKDQGSRITNQGWGIRDHKSRIKDQGSRMTMILLVTQCQFHFAPGSRCHFDPETHVYEIFIKYLWKLCLFWTRLSSWRHEGVLIFELDNF